MQEKRYNEIYYRQILKRINIFKKKKKKNNANSYSLTGEPPHLQKRSWRGEGELTKGSSRAKESAAIPGWWTSRYTCPRLHLHTRTVAHANQSRTKYFAGPHILIAKKEDQPKSRLVLSPQKSNPVTTGPMYIKVCPSTQMSTRQPLYQYYYVLEWAVLLFPCGNEQPSSILLMGCWKFFAKIYGKKGY